MRGNRVVSRALATSFIVLVVVVATLVGGSHAFTTGQSANLVLGQGNFTSGGRTLNASGFSGEGSVAFDPSGNLWVADTHDNRILEFLKGNGFTSHESASLVIGQVSFAQALTGSGPARLSQPFGLAFDSSGDLWVSDSGNNRVLEYLAPLTSDESASVVLGQDSFTSNSAATTAAGLSNPAGIAFDPSGNLWVVDESNNRVLEYSPPFTSGESASLVIGQSGFTSGGALTSSTGLRIPTGIAFDAQGDLWVVDQYNNRVLEYAPPFSTGESASMVVGQTDFTDSDSGVSASLFHLPVGVGFDSNGDLWVADTGNQRVMGFYSPLSTGEAASAVIGQQDFTSATPSTTANGLDAPLGVAFDSSGNLWVADSGNNRVLQFLGPNQSSSTSSASSTTSTSSTSTTSTSTTAPPTTTTTTTETTTETTTTTATTTTTVTSTTTTTATATTSTTSTLTSTVTSTTSVPTTTTISTTSTAVTTISTTYTSTATTTSAVTTTVTTTIPQTVTATATSTSTSTATQTVQTTQTTTQTASVTSTSTTTSTASVTSTSTTTSTATATSTSTTTSTATATQTVETTKTTTLTTSLTFPFTTTSVSTSTVYTTVGKCSGPGCSNTGLLAVAIAGVAAAVILFVVLLVRLRYVRRPLTLRRPSWRSLPPVGALANKLR